MTESWTFSIASNTDPAVLDHKFDPPIDLNVYQYEIALLELFHPNSNVARIESSTFGLVHLTNDEWFYNQYDSLKLKPVYLDNFSFYKKTFRQIATDWTKTDKPGINVPWDMMVLYTDTENIITISALVQKLNAVLERIYGYNAIIPPKLVLEKDTVSIIPGHPGDWAKDKIFTIPNFDPNISELLGLWSPLDPGFEDACIDMVKNNRPSLPGRTLVDKNLNHFYYKMSYDFARASTTDKYEPPAYDIIANFDLAPPIFKNYINHYIPHPKIYFKIIRSVYRSLRLMITYPNDDKVKFDSGGTVAVIQIRRKQ